MTFFNNSISKIVDNTECFNWQLNCIKMDEEEKMNSIKKRRLSAPCGLVYTDTRAVFGGTINIKELIND
jgi:hypothetical protein